MNGRHDEIASAMPANLDSLPRLRGFRLRGMEMTRLETFIDAAFAFAISMLVIAANQVPDNIEELLGALQACARVRGECCCAWNFLARALEMEQALRARRWRVDFHQLGDAGHDPDLYLPVESGFRVDVVFSQRRPIGPAPRSTERCASARSFRDLCYRVYGHRTGDRAPESACLAIAGPVAIE